MSVSIVQSFVPWAHVGIDSDAVVGGVSQLLLGDFGRGVGGEKERV